MTGRGSGIRTGRSRGSSRLRDRSRGDDEEDGASCYDPHARADDDATGSGLPTPCSRDRALRSSARKSPRRGAEATSDYHLDDDESAGDSIESDLRRGEAHFRQRAAPCSTAFYAVQCVILPVMMWQCGIAPMNINPMVGPYPDALNYWGAKNAILIIDDGEFWRLFTPIFLHAGLIHLVGNVMVQMDLGNQWEKEWGSTVWMVVYIGSAFGSSVLSTCFMSGSISVGSSGAVMGLFGAKLSEIFLLCCEKSRTVREVAGERSRKQQTCLVVGGIVIVGVMSFIPYVDWAAHLGGMVAGFVLGLVCFSFRIRSWFFMLTWLVVGVGLTVALCSTGMAYMYNEVETNDELRDVCGYYKQYFDDYECQCMLDEAIQFGSWQFGGSRNNDGSGYSNSHSEDEGG